MGRSSYSRDRFCCARTYRTVHSSRASADSPFPEDLNSKEPALALPIQLQHTDINTIVELRTRTSFEKSEEQTQQTLHLIARAHNPSISHRCRSHGLLRPIGTLPALARATYSRLSPTAKRSQGIHRRGERVAIGSWCQSILRHLTRRLALRR